MISPFGKVIRRRPKAIVLPVEFQHRCPVCRGKKVTHTHDLQALKPVHRYACENGHGFSVIEDSIAAVDGDWPHITKWSRPAPENSRPRFPLGPPLDDSPGQLGEMLRIEGAPNERRDIIL